MRRVRHRFVNLLLSIQIISHQRSDGRVNGRTYCLSPTKDKMWNLYHVNTTSEDEKGALIGKYQRRGDATKVVAAMAYQPEPRW